jgi:hypothetical protein
MTSYIKILQSECAILISKCQVLQITIRFRCSGKKLSLVEKGGCGSQITQMALMGLLKGGSQISQMAQMFFLTDYTDVHRCFLHRWVAHRLHRCAQMFFLTDDTDKHSEKVVN